MTEPMSDERLAEIRDQAANAFTYDDYHRVMRAVPELLAEVERLRGTACALDHDWAKYAVDLVIALASASPCLQEKGGCITHDRYLPDGGDCPHALAKAWLSGAHAHLRAGGGGQ